MVLCPSMMYVKLDAKSGTAITGDRLNGFKKGKSQQFNSGGVVKWACFQKKWSNPNTLREN